MAYGVHYIKKIIYGPIDEIMELAICFTETMCEECVRKIPCTVTYIYICICIFKVIKWPIIWENSIHLFEVMHNIQLCDACVYKNLHS